MIKSQLIDKLAATMTDIPEKQVADGVNRIIELMSLALMEGNRIEVRGFGSFSLRERPSRTAHNPKTGERVMTKNRVSPHFKPGKELKERVNASYGKIPLPKED